MESMMLLYEAVKNKLDPTYSNVFYQTMREDTVGDVGIYLYESSNDIEDMDGDVVYNCVKVQIQVNCDRSVQGLQKALDYLTKFTHRIEKEQCGISGLQFVEAQHQGPRAIAIGKNTFDILVCRSVIDLKYIYDSEEK